MLRKSEIRRIEEKKQEWDDTLADFNRKLNKTYKELKKDSHIVINWMFFYQPKNLEDKIWHLLEVSCVIVVLFNVWG